MVSRISDEGEQEQEEGAGSGENPLPLEDPGSSGGRDIDSVDRPLKQEVAHESRS